MNTDRIIVVATLGWLVVIAATCIAAVLGGG